jgi:hypothetical protein
VGQRLFFPRWIRQMLAIVSFQRWRNIYLEPLHATVRANRILSTQPHRYNLTISQSHRPQTSTTIMPHAQKQLQTLALSKRTQQLVELEHKYTAGGFRPMPAFFVEGKGAKLWVRLTVIPYRITIDQMKLKLLTPGSLRMLMGKNTLISLPCFRP